MKDIATRELGAGTTFWCVFPARYGATGFNPNIEGDPALDTAGGRFHPFESPAGTRVATKYLVDHENGALAETLLRDSPGEREVALDRVVEHRLALLALRRSLRLADLTEVSPATALGRLLRQGHKSYRPLRDVASTLHERHPHLEGLLWEGYQLAQPGMKCFMLFGDRVSGESDLDELRVVELDRGIGLRTLRAAARLRRFVLPKALALDGLSGELQRDRRYVNEDSSLSDVSPKSVVGAHARAENRVDRRYGDGERRAANPTTDQAAR